MVFTVPMRNWNHYINLHYINLHYSFYSTYEELKLVQLPKCNKIQCLFLQYLWGIETRRAVILRRDVFNSFYSTYEELKLCPFNQAHPLRKGFYSTYEELKPLPSIPFFLFIFCFYSTYEELKHAFNQPCIYATLLFLQYLWGIET